MALKQVLIIVQLLLSSAFAYQIPSFVHLCKRHDPNLEKCVDNTIHEILQQLSDGIKEMNVPPLDPLQFQNFSVETGSSRGPARFRAEVKEGTVTGTRNFEFRKLKYDLDDGRISMQLYWSFLNIKAQYKIRGKIMLFELDGSGPAEFNATGVVCDIDLYGRYHIKDNKKYLVFDTIHVDAVPEKMIFRFDNMFPRNPALTEALNNAINANAKSLANDLKPIIRETLAQLTLVYFNRVYSVFPINELYPED